MAKIDQLFITKAGVCAMLALESRQVQRLQAVKDDPLPIAVKGKPGQPHQYDAHEVHKWAIRRRLAELDVGEDGEVYDKESEQARLYHMQADKAELEVEQMRGNLLPTPAVLKTWQSLFANMRAKLLGLPTKAAHAVQAAEDLADIRDALTVQVHEALEEIATDGLTDDIRERIDEAANESSP